MTQIIDIADLDCIYLSYDEPRKEEFWILFIDLYFEDEKLNYQIEIIFK